MRKFEDSQGLRQVSSVKYCRHVELVKVVVIAARFCYTHSQMHVYVLALMHILKLPHHETNV